MSRGVAARISVDGCNEISPLLSVKDFLETCRQSLSLESLECQPPEETANEMGVSEETVAQVRAICHEDRLLCPAVPKHLEDWDVLTDGIPDGVNLVTLSKVKCLGEKKKPITSHIRNEKETNHLPSEEVRAMLWTDRKTVEPIPKPDAVLTIAINQPNNWRVRREYLLLSSQPLYALRDCIVCLTDQIVTTDHSDNPSDTSSQVRSKELCKSGFFFIENVFYNDMRDPTARDYSQVIIDWARRRLIKTPNVGNMTSRSMKGVTFQDLSIRLGFPYLYCHQGSCEHLITFKDLRLLHHSDPQNRLEYPHMTFRSREYKTRCVICNLFLARWITVNDQLAMEDPSFFCKKCFDALHYTEDGQEVCQFEAYPILDPEKD